jgi:hypothetical protein
MFPLQQSSSQNEIIKLNSEHNHHFPAFKFENYAETVSVQFTWGYVWVRKGESTYLPDSFFVTLHDSLALLISALHEDWSPPCPGHYNPYEISPV